MKRKTKFLILFGAPFLVGPSVTFAQIPPTDRASHARDSNPPREPTPHVDAIRSSLARSHVHLLSDTQVSRHSLDHWETREKDNVDIWYSNLVLTLANDFFNVRKGWFEKNRNEVMALPAGKEKDDRWRRLWNHRWSALDQSEKIYESALAEFRRRNALIATWKQWYLDTPATAGDKYAIDLPLEAKRREEAEAQIQSLGQAMLDSRKNF